MGYTGDGERCASNVSSSANNAVNCAAAQPTGSTQYAWNALGQLCWTGVSTAPNPTCGSAPSGATSFTYDGNGLLASQTTSAGTSPFTFDTVSGGTTPLDLSDGTNSYVYGPLLFGGTSPIEQIHGNTVSFIVPIPSGVQTVFTTGISAAVTEQAAYSVFGVQTIQTGADVTPFGFDGSYTLPNGLVYLINRYYDPRTAQFLSVDPDLAVTGQPYAFTGDNPLNATDPLGNVIRCEGPNCGPGSGDIEGPQGSIGCSYSCQGNPGYVAGQNYYAGPPASVLAAEENAAIGEGWLVGAIVNAENAKYGREEIEITEIEQAEKIASKGRTDSEVPNQSFNISMGEALIEANANANTPNNSGLYCNGFEGLGSIEAGSLSAETLAIAAGESHRVS